MFPFLRKRHESLESWLSTATHGLCDGACGRIAEEIASHYDDSLKDARASGLSENDAATEAVRSLGSPRQARRRLRTAHLMRWEHKLLAVMLNKYAEAQKLRASATLPRKDFYTVAAVVAMPFILLALIISVITLLDDSAKAMARDLLSLWPGLGAIAVSLVGLGLIAKFAFGNNRDLSIWRCARRRGVVFTVLALLAFGLSAYCIFYDFLDIDRWGPFPIYLVDIQYVLFTAGYLVCAIRYLRLYPKLCRLGYNQPPSAMV